MEEFILLGQVPGTNIVISFWLWLAVLAVGLMTYVIWHRLNRRSAPVTTTALATLRDLQPFRPLAG